MDTAEIFTRLQLKFQANQLTILQIPQHKDIAIAQLTQLAGAPKIGGWEELFIGNLGHHIDDPQKSMFFGHLIQASHTRQPNAFVTTSRAFSAIRNELITAATNFLQERLDSNKLMDLASVLNPSTIQGAVDDNRANFLAHYGNEQIQKLCNTYMPDLELAETLTEWTEVKGAYTAMNLKECSFLGLVKNLCSLTNKKMLTADSALQLISRIAVLSPHNMFVERCISSYDLIKDDDRASISRDTMNDYMMVRINMPVLANFDMCRAVMKYLREKDRRPHSVDIVKYKSQRWFTGVFVEANERQPPQKILPPKF